MRSAAAETRVATAARPKEADARGLLDVAVEALVVLGAATEVLYWNAGAQRIFGFDRDEAMGRVFPELLGPGAALRQDVMHHLQALGEWAGELYCVAADGRVVQAQCRCTARLDARGRIAAIFCALSDVTEQRRAEKEIVLLHNVMEQRIQRRTAELEESNEDLRGFAYSLAHDLRAPLASIDGFSAQLELRLAGTLDERNAHYLRRVRAGVQLMSDLTDALLGLADVANAELLHQRVDLSNVARAVTERLRESQPERDVTVVVEDTPAVNGDVRLLTDVLQNLMGNAWKFTSKTAQPRIEFGGAPTAHGPFAFHVKDNGAGFEPAYAYKLFGPFQRLHAAHEFGGTGIGLAMVRKIVSRHGGRVWAEAKPGEGASFFFTLG
ncbi:sensor histidine kinase [Ramlibacter sp. PS4R-6]|uniref:sensor histidine kinase n=1 Tax=Ramlibacter sp. PS4R-6 TaxID=3133438 RepID=UPI0030AFB8ED